MFEKKWNLRGNTLIANFDGPFCEHRPRTWAAFAANDWPLLVKLHGDFRESRLKNLAIELQAQDETLRRAVFDGSRRFGLIVAGYSGRDSSVMEMLRAASTNAGAWPSGLWWIAHDPAALPPHVRRLLDDLVERLAEEVAQLCLREPRVERVQVSLKKPGAVRFARSVGVTIERGRHDRG